MGDHPLKKGGTVHFSICDCQKVLANSSWVYDSSMPLSARKTSIT